MSVPEPCVAVIGNHGGAATALLEVIAPQTTRRSLPIVMIENEHDEAGLRRELFDAFEARDVWGVVSCGTARETQMLLKVLGPIDVPIFITVDSTSDLVFPPNVLRLMASNSAQAQAIVATVLAVSRRPKQPSAEVFFDGLVDPYVVDCVNTLRLYAESMPAPIVLEEQTDPSRLKCRVRPGVVICVGYPATARRLAVAGLRKGTHVICCDGCDGPGLAALLGGELHGHVARPVCRPSDHALDAYAVLDHLWESRHDAQSPRVRLQSRVVHAAKRLERTRRQRYQFVGGQNQRGGFTVVRLGSQEDVR